MLVLSWRLVTHDRRLLIFPAISALTALASIGLVFAISPHPGLGLAHSLVIPMIIASAPITFVTIACGVATSSLVGDVLDGREPSPRRALALVRRRLGVILAWTLVVWTIGAVLRLIEERVPFGGKVIVWLAGLGFAIATLFAIPVLAAEGEGPRATLRRSTELVRSEFGAVLTGAVVIGGGVIVTIVPFFVLAITGIAMMNATGVVLIVLALGYLLGVSAFTTTLDYAYRTVLYRDAVGLPTDRSGFTPEDLTLALGRG